MLTVLKYLLVVLYIYVYVENIIIEYYQLCNTEEVIEYKWKINL